MKYKEYQIESSKYTHTISRRRSLLMTIRMNEAWLTNTASVRGVKRVKKIEAAKSELAQITIPPKPQQPVGYELTIDGDYEGFYNSDDIKSVRKHAMECLGHDNFTLTAKPRWAD